MKDSHRSKPSREGKHQSKHGGKKTALFLPDKPASHRQSRVATEIQSILSMILMRGDLSGGSLIHPVTITDVRISPDLRRATIYVMPLGGAHCEEVLEQLEEEAPFFRRELARSIRLKFAPEIIFSLDNQFEQAAHLENLLSLAKKRAAEEESEDVASDLHDDTVK